MALTLFNLAGFVRDRSCWVASFFVLCALCHSVVLGQRGCAARLKWRPGRFGIFAQDKLPVYIEGTQIMIPQGSAPSNHLLKFASPHYSHLPENETFITLLAKEVGLPVVDVRIRNTAKSSITIIARYDRQWEAGQWMRRHQEDFCQALGIDASRKYEKEGGPSHKQCADLIRQHVTFPLVDPQKLLRWSL